ncbi:MAG TPA: MOSC domain-containing protein [Oligoflexia bacterium]|nr:MOSC domain-containing protein [Oligoflexia bacterium]HMP48979.1 MOSC domain-containing protein [Oligoflexia bacterium]
MYVKELSVYPIKSCARVNASKLEMDKFGAKFDRMFMLVTPEGQFLSQRGTKDKPGKGEMALIHSFIDEQILRVQAPGMEILSIDINERTFETLSATLHDERIEVAEVSKKANTWFSEFLDMPCRLVVKCESFSRNVNPDFDQAQNREVRFTDGFPFLLTNQRSLDDLNSRRDNPVKMNRFRPNIVIEGASQPYIEDSWRTVKIGELSFSVVKPCSRCLIINVNQENGSRDTDGPLKTLGSYRNISFHGKSGIRFGVNMIHNSLSGTIRLGDEVKVLE